MQEDNISFEEIGKDMIEKWNQFVYDLCDAKRRNVDEDEYHRLIEIQLQLYIFCPCTASGRNFAYQLFKSPAWKIRRPSVSTIHDTPLSVLPNAQTVMRSSLHVPPLASHTSASSLLALLRLRMSLLRI